MVTAGLLAALLALIVSRLAGGHRWGPGIHIQLTGRLLEEFRKLRSPGPEHRLVLTHTDSFLYGNVAADVINFKNYGGMKNHCHNWNIQERLHSLAHTDHERAFIHGYLCHLAVDVIAHNHFIPYHRVRGLPPPFLGHAYWEALADAGVTDEEWETLARLRHSKSLHRHDRLVWDAVPWKALGPRSNKWIFNNILLLNLRASWRELIRLARARRARYPIDSQFFRHCWSRCLQEMTGVFDPEHLAVLKLRDPTGRTALRGARILRRDLILKYGVTEEGREVSRRIAREAYWVI